MGQSVFLQDIFQAKQRLHGVVFPTDLVPSHALSREGLSVYIKTENLQHTGSFKLRGAYNRMAMLTPEEKKSGVIASSAGNHAQGVAWAARAFGLRATIVMPEGAPLYKIAATRALGAEVVLCGSVYDEAYQKAVQLQKEGGQTFIHPFNDPYIIAGQGTIGLEIMGELEDVDTIIVPIGGGGLAAGIAVAAKSMSTRVRIIGVEANGAASMAASRLKGDLVTLESAATIADGIAVKTPGTLTFDLCQQYVDEIVTVDEDEIASTILYLIERCKIVAEGAGAVSVAAILNEKIPLQGKVVAVLSGGNVDVNLLARIIDRGLIKAGRKVDIETVIEDKPGTLIDLLRVVGETGANVVNIIHDRGRKDVLVGYTSVELTLETQDQQHVDLLMGTLHQRGYRMIR